MADVLMVVLMVSFVGLCVAYVRWCDRIIGPDPERIDAPGLDETSSLTTGGAA